LIASSFFSKELRCLAITSISFPESFIFGIFSSKPATKPVAKPVANAAVVAKPVAAKKPAVKKPAVKKPVAK
jgi:hypothetical protein